MPEVRGRTRRLPRGMRVLRHHLRPMASARAAQNDDGRGAAITASAHVLDRIRFDCSCARDGTAVRTAEFLSALPAAQHSTAHHYSGLAEKGPGTGAVPG